MAFKKVTISLPEQIITKGKMSCENNGYTFSGFVRVSLEEKIKKLEENKQNF